MKIVVFVDAPHQRRYVDILSQATSLLAGTTVEAVDVCATPTSAAAEEHRGGNWKWTIWRNVRRLIPARRNLRRIVTSVMRGLRRRSFLYAISSERRWRQHLEASLFSRQPDLIVLLEDNAQGLTGLVSHAARTRKIPYVILPDYIPNPLEPARYYFEDASHSAHSVLGTVVRLLAPKWVYRFNNRDLLRLPPNAIFSRWLRGQRCPQPWILNAGYAEAILLDSNAAARHYLALGFHEHKLKIIGGAMEDVLHGIHAERAGLRERLLEKYQLNPGLPIVICGFPPDQYTAGKDGFEFGSYEDLCVSWFRALEMFTDRANFLVVRHPRTKAEVLESYVYGKVKIAEESLEAVLPVADIYVACVSTTIRWALALGIPVINYDTYRYNYGDFASAFGCIEVDRLANFQKAIGDALRPEALDDLKATARRDCITWGLMDGKFQERLCTTLLQVSQNYDGRPLPTHPESYVLGDVVQ